MKSGFKRRTFIYCITIVFVMFVSVFLLLACVEETNDIPFGTNTEISDDIGRDESAKDTESADPDTNAGSSGTDADKNNADGNSSDGSQTEDSAGKTDSSAAPTHTHSLDHIGPTSPTCTKDGNIAYYHCDGCGKNYSDQNGENELADTKDQKLGHNYSTTVVPPACTTDGYTKHVCSKCGDRYDTDPVTKNGHSWDEGTEEKAASCTEKGTTLYQCENCDATKREDIDMLPHDYEEDVVLPTCTTDGYTDHVCSVCGDSYHTDPVEANGHSWDEGTEEKAASCTEKGVTLYQCENCDATKREDIDMLPHDYEEDVVSPTCTTDGYTDHVCSVCGDSYHTAPVDANGHSWDEGTEEKAASCTEKGITLYQCENCDATRREDIDMLPHDYEESTVAPTASKHGYTSHVCSACGDSYDTDETHNFSKGICTVCSHVGYTLIFEDIDDKTCCVAGLTTEESDITGIELVIPSEYNGKSVTNIKDDAFNGCRIISYVFIPSSVVIIGKNAFNNCSNLGKVKVETTSTWYYTSDISATGKRFTGASNERLTAQALVDTNPGYYFVRR